MFSTGYLHVTFQHTDLAAGHVFYGLLACRVSGYIKLVQYKDSSDGFIHLNMV